MLKGHFNSAGASVPHGEASALFPVRDLDATVLQHRDAELALADAAGADVIVIAPTGLGSSYFLTQHPLTAIRIDSLPPALKSSLADECDVAIDAYELIQIGKWTVDSSNHSLTEFSGS